MKYLVNRTGIAYKFVGRILLGRKGVVAIDEKDEKELLANPFFVGLKNRDAVSVTKDAPSNIADKGAQIAAKDAEIKALKEMVAGLEKRLDIADGTGKDTSTVLDSDNPDSVGQAEQKKGGKKKED